MSTSFRGFKDNNASRGKRILRETWEARKSEILELYMNQRKTIEDVADVMENRGFVATIPQYRRQLNEVWDIKKHIPARVKKDWLRKQNRDPRRTSPKWHGHAITEKSLKRFKDENPEFDVSKSPTQSSSSGLEYRSAMSDGSHSEFEALFRVDPQRLTPSSLDYEPPVPGPSFRHRGDAYDVPSPNSVLTLGGLFPILEPQEESPLTPQGQSPDGDTKLLEMAQELSLDALAEEPRKHNAKSSSRHWATATLPGSSEMLADLELSISSIPKVAPRNENEIPVGGSDTSLLLDASPVQRIGNGRPAHDPRRVRFDVENSPRDTRHLQPVAEQIKLARQHNPHVEADELFDYAFGTDRPAPNLSSRHGSTPANVSHAYHNNATEPDRSSISAGFPHHLNVVSPSGPTPPRRSAATHWWCCQCKNFQLWVLAAKRCLTCEHDLCPYCKPFNHPRVLWDFGPRDSLF